MVDLNIVELSDETRMDWTISCCSCCCSCCW